MGTYYLLLSNPPTKVNNITEEQNTEETTNIERAEISKEETTDIERAEILEYSESQNKCWNSAMDKALIRLIKKEECLWNGNTESFKHRRNKWPAIDRVTKEMKRLFPNHEHVFTFRKCLSKFRNLRTYYLRERKKQLNGKMRNEPHTVRWRFFDDMSFINASDPPYKIANVEANHSPIIIQFSSDNKETQNDEIEENMDISRMLDQGNNSSTEDQMSPEEQNGVSLLDIPDCSEFKQISSKAKKKLFKPKVGTSSPNHFSKVQKTHNMKSFSPKPKNSEKCIAEVIPVNSNFFSKPQTIEMTHDEAFANFIVKDLGKIPEGKQKEQLRFKILELIHRCKMDANLMLD